MNKYSISFLSLLAGGVLGALGTKKIIDGQAEQHQAVSDKYHSLFLMMNQWVRVKQEGKSLVSYFEKNGYKEIAIYGMGYAGKTLVSELIDSTIKIKYGIDQDTGINYDGFRIISPEEVEDSVDVIIVTPIASFVEVERLLSKKMDCPIVSLEDILYEL